MVELKLFLKSFLNTWDKRLLLVKNQLFAMLLGGSRNELGKMDIRQIFTMVVGVMILVMGCASTPPPPPQRMAVKRAPSASLEDFLTRYPEGSLAERAQKLTQDLLTSGVGERFCIRAIQPVAGHEAGIVKIYMSQDSILVAAVSFPKEESELALLEPATDSIEYDRVVKIFFPGLTFAYPQEPVPGTGQDVDYFLGTARGHVNLKITIKGERQFVIETWTGSLWFAREEAYHFFPLSTTEVHEILETEVQGESGFAHLIPENLPGVPIGRGSVWWFVGTVKLFGFTFESSVDEPLGFVLWESDGLVYLNGKGRVTLRDGSTITFPTGD